MHIKPRSSSERGLPQAPFRSRIGNTSDSRLYQVSIRELHKTHIQRSVDHARAVVVTANKEIHCHGGFWLPLSSRPANILPADSIPLCHHL